MLSPFTSLKSVCNSVHWSHTNSGFWTFYKMYWPIWHFGSFICLLSSGWTGNNVVWSCQFSRPEDSWMRSLSSWSRMPCLVSSWPSTPSISVETVTGGRHLLTTLPTPLGLWMVHPSMSRHGNFRKICLEKFSGLKNLVNRICKKLHAKNEHDKRKWEINYNFFYFYSFRGSQSGRDIFWGWTDGSTVELKTSSRQQTWDQVGQQG